MPAAKLFSRLLPALAISLALLTAAPVHAGPIAPGSTVGGRTVGEWSAEWWKWLFSFPVGAGPATDTNGELGNLGNVGGPVFFVNASGGDPLTLSADVPEGQYLLFPVLSVFVYLSEAGNDEAAARALAESLFSNFTNLHVTIDGVPVANPYLYDESSPVFDVIIPPDGIDVAGTYSSLSRGYWLMLAPLSRGQHTLSFGGTIDGLDLTFDTNAAINVVPEPGTMGMTLLAGLGLAGVAKHQRNHGKIWIRPERN